MEKQFPFFCNVRHELHLHFNEWTIYILEYGWACKDSEFSFCPMGSYKGRKMTCSVKQGLSQTNDTLGYNWVCLVDEQ